MARKEEATLLLKIKEQGSSVLKSIPGMFSAIGKAALGAVAGLVSYSGAVIALASKASAFEEVERAFTNLANKQGQDAQRMLDSMRELSKGTVDDMELMKQANQAMLLGLPVDRFDEMLSIARSSSKATGQSMEFMLNSIVTGLGRGSKLMLDNLGIVFDVNKAQEEYAAKLGKTAAQLTDQEKKQAFLNKALEVGMANARAAGDGQLSLGDRFEQTKARGLNLAIVIGQKLGPSFQFLLNSAQDLFSGLENFANSSGATDIFIAMTKGVAFLKVAIMDAGVLIGNLAGMLVNTLAPAVQASVALISGDFSGAWSAIKQGGLDAASNIKAVFSGEMPETIRGAANDIKANHQKLTEDLKAIDDSYAQSVIENQNKQVQNIRDQKAIQAEEAAIEAEAKLEALRTMNEQEINELHIKEAMKADVEGQAELARLNAKIANETNYTNAIALNLQKQQLLKDMHDKADRQRFGALHQFKMFLLSEELRHTGDIMGQISTLQYAKNKQLVMIGKAAAIAHIIINTSVAITRAYAELGPIAGSIFAPLLATAGAVQAARVAEVELAEGGIVKATEGGVSAKIGEGGRDEAVIPLDDDGGPGDSVLGGRSINVTVYGGLLGDQQQAREFALAVDRELNKLRQNNESIFADGGIV